MAGAARGRPNAPRWQGQAPFYEDWYAKANLPERDASVWVRYTLRAPPGAKARASIWGIMDVAGEHVAARATVAADEARLEGEPFRFATPEGTLEAAGCHGDLNGLSWRLAWEPTAYAFHHLPSWAYRLPDAVSKTITPQPDLRVHGHVQFGDDRLVLDHAPGQQGHVWGTRHADAWAWAHCNAHEDVVWEAAAVRAEPAGHATPALATVLVRHEGETLAFHNPLFNRAEFGAEGVTFRARTLRHRVKGRVAPESLARVTYTDPDGTDAFCHNTKRANSRLVLEERTWTGWREVGRWEDEDRTAFEVGLREPIEGVPSVLGSTPRGTPV